MAVNKAEVEKSGMRQLIVATPFGFLNAPASPLGRFASVIVHTVIVYVCAVHFSPWLVGRWFAWGVPLLQISATTRSADWYMQHLELVSIVPATLAGYINVRRPTSPATWSWLIPSLVLGYKLLRYLNGSSSVLFHMSVLTGLSYFFRIERVMPTVSDPLAGDPVRVLTQMLVTAPFYAGVAYSLGAFGSKRHIVRRVREALK